jgi:hypothetical protein
MDEQSAREPLLDVETVGPVENVQAQDGIHEQDGKFLYGVLRTSVVQSFSLTFALYVSL